MPDFAYVARTITGQRVEGVLAANTQREALSALSAKELFPVQVKAAGGKVRQPG
jgi:type II secretory pathway component PulF